MERSLNTRTLLVTLALAFALALLSTGCNTGTEEPEAPAPEMPSESMGDSGSTPDTADSSGDASAEAGDIDPSRFPEELPEGVLAEMPSNFPEDLPVYPNAVPSQGRGGLVAGRELSAVQLLSNDSPSDARTYYERELAANGWTIDKAEEQGVGVAIAGSRNDCKVTIMIMPSETSGSDIFTVSECGE